MNKHFNIKESFIRYIDELEGYSMRSERLQDEFEHSMDYKRLLEWLESAYAQGAKDMAQDTLETLGDYGAALAGFDDRMYTPSDCFDKSADNLKIYYDDVFQSK